MSRFGRLLQFFKDRVPFSARMPTALAQPQRSRKYTDIQLPTVATVTQHEPPPPDTDVVVLKGITKQCVLLQLEYRDYLFKKTNIFADKPEYVERCYDLMELVSADKPVKQDVSYTQFLFEMCPELFPAETLQSHLELPMKEHYQSLSEGGPLHERKFFAEQNAVMLPTARAPTTAVLPQHQTDDKFQSALGSFSIKEVADAEPLHDFLSAEEIRRRQVYIWQETKDIFQATEGTIAALAGKLGNVYSALEYISLKGDKRTPEEQAVIDGMQRTVQLMEKHEEYKRAIARYMLLHPVLPFPMPEYLQEMYIEKLKWVWQECYVSDITEYLGVPDRTQEYHKELEFRYQRALDLQTLSEKDRKEALKMIEDTGSELIVRRDLNAKDAALIAKMNVLANTVEVKKMPEPKVDLSSTFNPELLKVRLRDQMAADVGEGLLSPENIIKVLYLNSCKPEVYDAEFWAEIFNLPPQTIKNIFNHISYPVIVGDQAVGRISYTDIPRKKQVIDLEEENLKQFQSNPGGKFR